MLFTTNALYRHLYPMLPLMNAAQQAEHEVVVATGADFRPQGAAGARVLQADIAAMPSANKVLTRIVALADEGPKAP